MQIASFLYYPVFSQSEISFTFHCRYNNAGWNSDSWQSQMLVNGTRYSWSQQIYSVASGGGTRSGTLLPLTGTYISFANKPLLISFQLARITSDDPIYAISDAGAWLKIVESSTITASPTTEPSFTPTAEPTFEPTTEPTAEPSLEPTTETPSSQPTLTPTSPTVSFAPSATPTLPTYAVPSRTPSRQPSVRPTRMPSRRPSLKPSKEPTTEPTKRPTTVVPTSTPTAPTNTPTVSGYTYAPTLAPTVPTTFSPTATPTFEPTAEPTLPITSEPTGSPTTTFPSNAPTYESGSLVTVLSYTSINQPASKVFILKIRGVLYVNKGYFKISQPSSLIIFLLLLPHTKYALLACLGDQFHEQRSLIHVQPQLLLVLHLH